MKKFEDAKIVEEHESADADEDDWAEREIATD